MDNKKSNIKGVMMKSSFAKIALASIFMAASFQAAADKGSFSIETNNDIQAHKIQSYAAAELRLLSNEIGTEKHSILIESFTAENAPSYLARKNYVIVTLLDAKDSRSLYKVRFDGPAISEKRFLILAQNGIKSIALDIQSNAKLKSAVLAS